MVILDCSSSIFRSLVAHIPNAAVGNEFCIRDGRLLGEGFPEVVDAKTGGQVLNIDT